jgi:SH3-like domain-containing protein
MTGRRTFGAWALAGLLFAGSLPASPLPAAAADKALPIPRFAALRSEPVNVRTGPGERYPIDWIFNRKDLPVEIVAEFENWRKIRDVEGAEGWVHQRMLVGKRSILVRDKIRELHRKPQAEAEIVARLEPNVVAKLVECQGPWCRVEAQGIAGWLRRGEFWGVYPNEAVQ